jgi:protein-L-isoaspartate(D-aspartate) O-methyltransferase
MPDRRVRTRPVCLVFAWLVLGAAGTGCVIGGQGPAVDANQDTSPSDPRARERLQMVRTQIESRDVTDPAVLAAMRKVPRHLFVPAHLQDEAYADGPLPIGFGQTISQPYIVAYMSELLDVSRPHKVLEIGTGSGYQAAVLGELAGRVFTIEIVPELGERARTLLQQLGYANVHVRVGDGYGGWPEEAPFDRIMVTAAPDHVPPPLVDQLAVGGILVLPVGTWHQEIVVITRTLEGTTERHTIPVRFVPLTRRPGAQ